MKDREARKLERLELLQSKFELAEQIEEECGVRISEREIEKFMTMTLLQHRRYSVLRTLAIMK